MLSRLHEGRECVCDRLMSWHTYTEQFNHKDKVLTDTDDGQACNRGSEYFDATCRNCWWWFGSWRNSLRVYGQPAVGLATSLSQGDFSLFAGRSASSASSGFFLLYLYFWNLDVAQSGTFCILQDSNPKDKSTNDVKRFQISDICYTDSAT